MFTQDTQLFLDVSDIHELIFLVFLRECLLQELDPMALKTLSYFHAVVNTRY
jgi:hypothetical protein